MAEACGCRRAVRKNESGIQRKEKELCIYSEIQGDLDSTVGQ